MNSLFNPQAGADSTKELIPDGTLAFAFVSMSDKGLANSQSTGGEYANLVITLDGGKEVARRKVFHMLANPLDMDNSEAWRKMSISAITRILEACGTFDYEQPESYKIFDFDGVTFSHMLEQIEGQSIAVEIGIQKGQDGHADKNVIKTFLTPSKEKSSKRGRQLWDILISGGTTSKVEKRVIPGATPGAQAGVAAKTGIGPAAIARAAVGAGIVPPAAGGGFSPPKPSGGIGAPKWANRPAAPKPAADPAPESQAEPQTEAQADAPVTDAAPEAEVETKKKKK
jgi:hypothetical protein